ncbi:L-idonate 5-dehydrogenase [Hoeflea prorocentri]|uniref:L-idonate 5-dehydrogenase n=1 Tax=Hoeflea prorocentri TaxID=1922333 RepID=A0A9X3ZGF2_9HYPH|nr:L-idonate 5-dehydrogenase [Hoeflea prorocentri]MCY6379726.1 L-idonate 5-dehydrogenase [Hoeflea prorocentri]MDA5397526.1 L-idonate 5-dehydrogenase [Hoeflea prorocentri]
MKAIVIHAAKDLRVEDRAIEQPGEGQVRVKLAAGGICGSDLHYFNHGGFGTVRLKEPMILGHEVAGRIDALGKGVAGLQIGDLVAVSPSRPCHACEYCDKGLYNHCLNMRFYGSAMPFPHIQGAFREVLVADANQCVLANGITPGEAAMAEPLSVCLHAARRAGSLAGKKVLITGSGPIGTLCVLAAKDAGAAEIIVTDLSDEPLEYASTVGATQVINVAKDANALGAHAGVKGTFDVLFECSGAAPALRSAIPLLRPRGIIMQLGLGGDMELPVMQITAKELELRGSFRFHGEFAIAVEKMQSGAIDVKPLISHSFRLEEAETAFQTASDRLQSMKAQIVF